MNTHINALKSAFPHTIPVLAGFLVLGMAYGLLMASIGFGFVWSSLVSVFVFAGAMQFIAVAMLSYGFEITTLVFMLILVNSRHIFYGLSMLEKFKNTGWIKALLIFGLCDETYSILCSATPPPKVEKRWFMFYIALLNHFYWVAGTALGGILGEALTFDITGVDFSLTALFTVIMISQWQTAQNRLPSCMGITCALICRLIFGPEHFLIPAMIMILLFVTVMRTRLEGGK